MSGNFDINFLEQSLTFNLGKAERGAEIPDWSKI